MQKSLCNKRLTQGINNLVYQDWALKELIQSAIKGQEQVFKPLNLIIDP